jgi:predicted KAP-like P-loop ATPase
MDEPNTEELKTHIQEFIDQIERRLVVVIDDVDRLQADELLTLFKTVRLAATFRNVIFVWRMMRNRSHRG